MKRYTNTAILRQDSLTTGNADEGVPIRVFIAGSTTVEASLFSDVGGTTPIVQPFTSDTIGADMPGQFSFYSAGGLFDIYFNFGTGSETSIKNQWISTDVDPKDFGAIGDGVTDDTVAVQAALDTVADGGVVTSQNNLPFLVGSLTLPATDNITIGKGQYKLAALTDNAMFIGTTLNKVTFDSTQMDGNAAAQTPLATEGNASRGMIYITGTSTDITVKNCRVDDSSGAGIVVNDTTNAIITNNIVDTCNGHGIQVAGDTVKATITGNMVKNIDDGAGIIPMGNATHVTVANNVIETITGTGGDAITCYSDNNEFITISGNIIKDVVTGHGIHAGGAYLSITGNVVDSAAAGGIYVKSQTITTNNVSITGNSVDGSTFSGSFAIDGIYVNNVTNFTVTGNSIKNGQDVGLHLKQCSIGIVSGNSIQTSTNYGVWSEIDGQRISYTGNTIKDCGDSGVLFDSETQGIFSDNLIENYSTTNASSYGMEIVAGSFMTITGNSVRAGSGTLSTQPDNNFDIGSATKMRVQNNWFTDGSNMRTGTVASATTITIPDQYDYMVLTGATAVVTINTGTSWDGRVINIKCSTGANLTDNTGNLKMAGNFAPTGGASIISFVLDSGTWHEISRSQN